MSSQETLTRYVANFIDELVLSGVKNVVISPGSRSTPLSMTVNAHEGLKKWVLVDERSAAFFALGIAQKTNQPVVLICTSGTAAANYYPAIIEAYYARVPLIILTADRPHRLRDVGAPQTINQINLYGKFVKDFQEMAPPSDDKATLKYVRQRAARAIRMASAQTMGPVQLNFPFDEPLIPDLTLKNMWGNRMTAYNPVSLGQMRLSREQLFELKDEIDQAERPLIVCGPQPDKNVAQSLIQLAKTLAIPVLMDPVSQGRTSVDANSTVITTYDAIFREQEIRDALKPDLILRFGAMPISKMYRFFVEEHGDVTQYVVESSSDILEPTNHSSKFLMVDSAELCQDLLQIIDKQPRRTWLEKWLDMDQKVIGILAQSHHSSITEGEVVKVVQEVIPECGNLFVSNSMPVRDVDTFFASTEKDLFLYANRGVSGIDGIQSTALGMAAVTHEATTLIQGDLSFYHDMNGLFAAKKYDIPLTIVLINNEGGGIFSFLPQAKEKDHFEPLFGTALNLEFKHAVKLYDGNHTVVKNQSELKTALEEAYKEDGLDVIEVRTDRQDNLNWHKALWKKITKEVRDLI